MDFASKNLTAGELNNLVKIIGGETEARRLLQGKLKVEVAGVVKKNLKSLGTVVVPAMKGFIVKKFFVVDKNYIKWIGGNFAKWFLGIVEEPVGKVEFRHSSLEERSVDNLIIKELGGKKKVQSFFSQLSNLMDNVLKRDGTVYVSYAETTVFEESEENLAYKNEKGKKVVLRAVGVDWYGGGWRVSAYSVEDLCMWHVGNVVFSHNS